jgi:hypothetical protein
VSVLQLSPDQLAAADDDLQQVIEIMRDTGGQAT